jgi:hypothetical protein
LLAIVLVATLSCGGDDSTAADWQLDDDIGEPRRLD